jgi:hypothetical protein
MAPKKKPVKKAMKRPTGELPKRNSKLAKFIKGSDDGKSFTMPEARTAAGKYRDLEKAAGPKGFGSLDKSGVALGKAEDATKKMRAKPKPKHTPKPASTNPKLKKSTTRGPKAGSGVASKVASRAKSIAREVRDVPTAVGTSVMGYLNPHGIVARGPSTKNLAKQVKEAGRAVLTGKKGTASDRNTRSVRGEFGSSTGKYGYEKGKKRK